MTATTARALLSTLRRKGVRMQPTKTGLHVDAPRGAITPEIKKAIGEKKPELLTTLSEEQRVLEMSLASFEASGLAIELTVPGIAQTLWWVPTDAHARLLVRRGISRGRIWTAKELTYIDHIDSISRHEIRQLAILKVQFGLQILSVTDDDAAEGDND